MIRAFNRIQTRISEHVERAMHLDRFPPAYDFRQFHQVSFRAPVTCIFRAIKVLNRADLRVMRLLLAIRSLPAPILRAGAMEQAKAAFWKSSSTRASCCSPRSGIMKSWSGASDSSGS